MRPIITVILLVDIAMILVAAYAIVFRAPTADRPRPIWSSFVISLMVGGSTSLNIAGTHAGKPGADILAFAGPMMIGMAIMGAMFALRQRREGEPARPA